MQIGPLEIMVILLIALLIFGPNKLPELARTVGRGMRELRQLQRMVQRELDEAMAEPPPTAKPEPAASTDDGANGSRAAPRPATPAPRAGLDPPPTAGTDGPAEGS
jgi:TatA/E family protein of Tat protein translocase